MITTVFLFQSNSLLLFLFSFFNYKVPQELLDKAERLYFKRFSYLTEWGFLLTLFTLIFFILYKVYRNQIYKNIVKNVLSINLIINILISFYYYYLLLSNKKNFYSQHSIKNNIFYPFYYDAIKHILPLLVIISIFIEIEINYSRILNYTVFSLVTFSYYLITVTLHRNYQYQYRFLKNFTLFDLNLLFIGSFFFIAFSFEIIRIIAKKIHKNEVKEEIEVKEVIENKEEIENKEVTENKEDLKDNDITGFILNK